MKHADLTKEVTKRLRRIFTPSELDLKKRIANLIELEFMKKRCKRQQIISLLSIKITWDFLRR